MIVWVFCGCFGVLWLFGCLLHVVGVFCYVVPWVLLLFGGSVVLYLVV